jgi:hypothetical protein
MRGALVLVPTVLALALAPVQCSKKYDDGLRREDTAGDGLWGLAEDFRAKGDDKSCEATLRFLVKRYPSSRRAAKAKEALDARGAASPAPAAPPASAAPTP